MTLARESSSGRNLWKALLALVVVAAIGGYFLLSKPVTKSGLRRAPSFTLKDPSGKKISLSDFKDEVVILHFWAAWCGPCIPEIPEILGAAKKLPADSKQRPIRWILISVDEGWEKARKVLNPEQLPSGAIALIDPESALAEKYGTFQYPETYVLTRDHEIATKWIGPQEWSGDWGTKALAGLEALSVTNSRIQ